MESIWKRETELGERSAIREDYRADAVVVGAGMAGVLTAYKLQKAGLSVIVLEAERVGSGQTQNTTAKITAQHNLIYDRLIRQIGRDLAGQYARANQKAIAEFEALIRTQKIDCDFRRLPAYLYTNLRDKTDLVQEAKSAKSLGLDASFVTESSLPISIGGAVRFENQAQFQPLKFLKALADELTIFEKSRVYKVEGGRVYTAHGCVDAKAVVLACHFPFVNRPGYYFLRMHQSRSYVVALENAAELDGMYLGLEGLSFRNYGSYLLLGGGGHRTGEHPDKSSYDRLERAARWLWPDARVVAKWSAQDCMTMDGIPYIGRFSNGMPQLYVVTGFNKWGMTSSMVAAQILTEQVLGWAHPLAEVFSPQRFHTRASAANLLKDGIEAVTGLGLKKLTVPERNYADLKSGEARVVDYDGVRAGVYRDEGNETHVVSVTCPHLGCVLSWNGDERSWDCPCHGSRFDYKGALLSGPALEGLHQEAQTVQ